MSASFRFGTKNHPPPPPLSFFFLIFPFQTKGSHKQQNNFFIFPKQFCRRSFYFKPFPSNLFWPSFQVHGATLDDSFKLKRRNVGTRRVEVGGTVRIAAEIRVPNENKSPCCNLLLTCTTDDGRVERRFGPILRAEGQERNGWEYFPPLEVTFK